MKKVRRPKTLFKYDVQEIYVSDMIYDDQPVVVIQNSTTSRVSVLKLKETKILQNWLNQAIQYLEQERKKK